jgi:hypothetical protein
MRKSQASVEYLVILAAVVIISLAVVGVLTGFPSLSRGISSKETIAYWQSAEIGIEAPYMSSSASAGTSNMLLRNNRNFNVVVNTITFGGTSVHSSGLPATLSPGESKSVHLIAQNPCSSSGGTYAVNVAIGYSDATTAANNYTFTGQRPLIGTCQ